MAIKGVPRFHKDKAHVITTQTEHKCVLDSCRAVEAEGVRVTYLPVRPNGLIDLEDLRRALTPDTALVSIMGVNNEIGKPPSPLILCAGSRCCGTCRGLSGVLVSAGACVSGVVAQFHHNQA